MASLLNPDQPMVVPADIARRLNDRFYSSKPHRYFEVRLLALLSLDDDRTALSDSTLGEHALGGELEFEPETIDPTEIELFVAAEAEVLHHHASEVLVRYLLGHAGFPACPWLEIASLSNFRDFKQAASNWANLDAGTFRREVRELCFGNQVETDFQREQASVVAAVAQAAASRILNDAPLYNSAKHGFTVLVGRSALEFRSTPRPNETDEERQIRAQIEDFLTDQGISLESMEWKRENGRRSWQTAVRYVDPDHAVASTWVVVRVLSNLVAAMTARYSGGGEVRWYELSNEHSPRALRDRAVGKGTVFTTPVAARPLDDEEARRVLTELRERNDR